jgi:hypothetical protein
MATGVILGYDNMYFVVATMFYRNPEDGDERIPWKVGTYQPAQHDSQKTIIFTHW